MKQIFNIAFLTLCALFFAACKDNKIDSSVISSGSVMSDEAREAERNLDKASYAELADLFLDTNKISFDKEVLLIFGKNGCSYCEILKKDIKNNAQLKQKIKENFNPYYINTSYTKKHDIIINGKTANAATQDFVRIFNVNFTPNIVFLNKNGSVKYLYPGYTPDFAALVALLVTQNEAQKNGDSMESKKSKDSAESMESLESKKVADSKESTDSKIDSTHSAILDSSDYRAINEKLKALYD